MKMNKKTGVFAFLFLSCVTAFAVDFSFRAMPAFNVSWEENFENAFGISGALDLTPFTVRGRDNIVLSLQGNASQIKADGLDDMWIFDGVLGAGYEFRAHDRFSVLAEGLCGFWSVPEDENQGFEAASGLSYGGRLSANFYVIPEFSAGLFGGIRYYSNRDSMFTGNTEIGVCLKYNFSKGLFGQSDIKTVSSEVNNLFPVFFSYYNENGFGTITFVNNEPTDIKDVEVQIFIEQFMVNPNTAASFPKIKKGQEFTADLKAFLDETILTNLTLKKADAQVIVKYKSLGKTKVYTEKLELNALGRNNMSWEDDRRAAAFVSGKDGSAAMFARQVQAVVRDEISSKRNVNIQYAAALFGALKAYGMNYVIDPSSAFKDNSGTSSVDFLQFPYQTILYHGGDCDDLSILNCSLFEALGIDTAFITVPGHIYIAFDSGVSPENAASITDGMYIVQDGKVWIPLEITLCQDSFALERQTGFREWKKYPQERKLIPLKKAWEEYKPVSIPDSEIKLEIPSKNVILREFRNNL